MQITAEYLRKHPKCIFVFGDNTLRRGKKGAAILRDEINAYGFITKKYPNYNPESYYYPKEYTKVFAEELFHLENMIVNLPEITFLISQLGSGLANRYHIWEEIVQPGLEVLRKYPNVKFLWEE
jgi:hypothetical protein